MIDPPSTELGMANEDAIDISTKTPTFKEMVCVIRQQCTSIWEHVLFFVVDDAERLEVENKLIARICLASKNSKKQALQKNKAKRIIKII
jgi:hypothetical protein